MFFLRLPAPFVLLCYIDFLFLSDLVISDRALRPLAVIPAVGVCLLRATISSSVWSFNKESHILSNCPSVLYQTASGRLSLIFNMKSL